MPDGIQKFLFKSSVDLIGIYFIMQKIYICGAIQLLCVGIQTFTTNGELMEERHTFKHESWSTSRGQERYTATGLLPNCHYTCHMVSVAQERQSDTEVAPQATFHTSPGSKLTAE